MAGVCRRAAVGRIPSSRSAAPSSAGGFTIVFEEIVVIAAIFSLLLTHRLGREEQTAARSRSMLWSATGAMLMAGAANLMMIFLGLELLSLALYCLCGYSGRRAVARGRAQVSDPLLDCLGFHALRHGAALRRDGSVSLAALLAPARVDPLLRWAPASSWSASLSN